MTQYHSTLCGCIYEVDASYDYISQNIEIEAVITSHICDKHLPEKNRLEVINRKDIRILELLEQNRQLKERCKRLDEYDDLVDMNAQLLEALKFYANDENWQSEIDGFGEFVLAYKMQADMGQIARQALAAAGGNDD